MIARLPIRQLCQGLGWAYARALDAAIVVTDSATE
jgi:hypothetical protein